MKKLTLLLLLFGMNVPVSAMDSAKVPLIPFVAPVVPPATPIKNGLKKIITALKSKTSIICSCCFLTGAALIGASWGFWVLSNSADSLPSACWTAPINRSEALCLGHDGLVSHDWLVIKTELDVMSKRYSNECVPASTCVSYRGMTYTPVVTVGNGIQQQQGFLIGWGDVQYAVCNKGTFLGKVKDYLTNQTAYWSSVPTQDDTEGLIFPKEFNDYVINSDAYDAVIRDPKTWGRILGGQYNDGVECSGQAFE